MLAYDIKVGWIELAPDHEIDLEERDYKIITEQHGKTFVTRTILAGSALERQRQRTPEPRQLEQKVETAPFTPDPAPSIPEPINEPVDEAPTGEIEPIPENVEAIVGSFSRRQGTGVARVTRKFRREGFTVIRIDQKDAITVGELYEGRFIRCHVAPPDPGEAFYNAREIEIYQDLTAQVAEEN